MWYYDDGLDYSKPADREYIEKRKQEERERRIKEENNKILRCRKKFDSNPQQMYQFWVDLERIRPIVKKN